VFRSGDSAKALAVAGLSVIGRDTFGVFPLRGKVLNVRDATHKQIVENVELTQLATILGLNPTMTYESDADMKTLRYGKLMLMTDQDHDGSHIKGLIINWLHFFWPKLLQRDGFLQEFITPIVKAKKSSGEMSFFSLQEFQNWRASLASAKSLVVPPSDGSTPLPLPSDFGWRVKYYKGLGTSTAVEGKQYFGELEQHKIAFRWSAEGADSDRIDLAFRRARADNRKAWLSAFVPGTHIDHSLRTMTYGDFIDKELIQFSMADNVRSIPSLVDGLKNGQRKVLFACLKRSLTRELKVAQLAGYVSEHTGYHHGEVSLHGTIVNLAQDFVGSNNLPLLVPAGQFGTRHAGGKDAASARYIFTHLAPLTRSLFRAEDDAVLTYRDDDGQPVEPVHYLPVIPLVLLNGVEGVGTGYSTSIPRFHPLHVLQNVRCALQQQPLQPLVPCTLGFQGEVLAKAGSDQHFISKGKAHKSSPSTIEITELPLEMWTNDYKVELESLIDSKHSDSFSIKSFTEHHTDKFVHFRVVVDENRAMPKSLTAALKLEVPISLSNMHLFDCQGRIKRYSSANDIITEFVPYRLQYYEKRRLHQLATFKQQQRLVGAKVEFVDLVCDGRLKLQQQSRADVEQQLIDRKLDPFPGAMPAEDIEATTETDSPGATKKASKSKCAFHCRVILFFFFHLSS
jgi:DNA topoisomerase-2